MDLTNAEFDEIHFETISSDGDASDGDANSEDMDKDELDDVMASMNIADDVVEKVVEKVSHLMRMTQQKILEPGFYITRLVHYLAGPTHWPDLAGPTHATRDGQRAVSNRALSGADVPSRQRWERCRRSCSAGEAGKARL